MPDCWYLLLKFYLRIDGVAVRVRETRLFHNFSKHISRKDGNDGKVCTRLTICGDVSWKELNSSSTDDVGECGATEKSDTTSTKKSTNTFNPNHPLYSRSQQGLQSLPIINEQTSIPRYFELTFDN